MPELTSPRRSDRGDDVSITPAPAYERSDEPDTLIDRDRAKALRPLVDLLPTMDGMARGSTRRLARAAAAVSLLCAAIACSERARLAARHVTDTALVGEWQVTLRVEPGGSAGSAQGVVLLRRDSIDREKCTEFGGDSVACATHVRGSTDADLSSLVGHSLDATIDAAVMENGDAILQLGGCCDAGELRAEGRFSPRRVEGRWHETGRSRGRSGTFVMQRDRGSRGQAR